MGKKRKSRGTKWDLQSFDTDEVGNEPVERWLKRITPRCPDCNVEALYLTGNQLCDSCTEAKELAANERYAKNQRNKKAARILAVLATLLFLGSCREKFQVVNTQQCKISGQMLSCDEITIDFEGSACHFHGSILKCSKYTFEFNGKRDGNNPCYIIAAVSDCLNLICKQGQRVEFCQ